VLDGACPSAGGGGAEEKCRLERAELRCRGGVGRSRYGGGPQEGGNPCCSRLFLLVEPRTSAIKYVVLDNKI